MTQEEIDHEQSLKVAQATVAYMNSKALHDFIELQADHEVKQMLELFMLASGSVMIEAMESLNFMKTIGGGKEEEHDVDRFYFYSAIRAVQSPQVRQDHLFLTLIASEKDLLEVEEMSQDNVVQAFHNHLVHSYTPPSIGPYGFGVKSILAALVDEFNYAPVHLRVDTTTQTGVEDLSGEIIMGFRNPQAFYKTLIIVYDHQPWIDDWHDLVARGARAKKQG